MFKLTIGHFVPWTPSKKKPIKKIVSNQLVQNGSLVKLDKQIKIPKQGFFTNFSGQKGHDFL
jgi:hypothetical protein